MRFLVKKKLLRPYATGAGTGYEIPLPTGAGSTYYVSPTGNNSNNGSSGQPWLTPAKAASTATTPGDVVVFRDGTYSPSLVTPPAGSVGTPITWVAENCGGAIFDGLYYIDFGLLLENCNYFHLRGFDVQNYAYGALWSNANNSTSTYTTNVTIDYCYIHNNGRTPRPVSDSLGYVGLYTNGMTHSWTVDKCGFFLNGRKPNHDFDGETSGNNHNYRHDHGWYCQGYNHTCSNNYFMGHTSGYPIRTGGYWKATALTAGEYSVSIMDCKFFTSLNESVYGDVHGLIGVYNNLTAHGGALGTTKEGVLRVENCIAAASRAGTGTNTLIGLFNDAQSYGSTTTTHRFVNNTCASAKLYNEGESWLASHTGITATGNTVNTPVSDATLTTWFSDASTLLGKTVGESGAYPWTPHILPRTAQVGFWDARNSSKVTEVSGLVSDWANENYDAVSWTQATAANRPDYVSSSIRPLDSTDFMENATTLYPITNGDFTFLMVGSDNKLSVGAWIRLTNYTGGGSGFRFTHFGSSWFAYYDQGGGGQSGSFTSASYTANTDVMFSFKHDASTDFEVFENGTSRLNFTPAAPWTSTAALLFPTGGGVGMDKCKAILAIAGDATTPTRQYAEGFLAWEFGLQGSLAGVHPWDADYPNVTDVAGRLWVPSDLPSLSLWLDAMDASTITLNGATVAQWDDKSGTGNHMTQGTAANQPTYNATGFNSLPTLVFDGSNDFLGNSSPVNLNSSGDYFYAAVFAMTTPVNWGMVMGGRTTFNAYVFPNGGIPLLQRMSTSSQIGIHTTDIVDTRIKVDVTSVTAQRIATAGRTGGTLGNGGTVTISATGNSQPTYTTTGTQTWDSATNAVFQIGGRQQAAMSYYNGQICECIAMSADASTEDRQRLEGYLAHKWQLQASLPSDHPYRHFPPTTRLWTPSDLPSLAAWFDAADASTITLNGSRVSQWDDKSGNNYHLTQATAGKQPLYEIAEINGLNVVTNDSGRFLTRNSSIPMLRNVSGGTLIAVVRYESGTTGGQLNGMSVHVNNGVLSGATRLGLTPAPSPGTVGRYSLAGRRLDADSYEAETGPTSISTSFAIEVGNADYANAQANHWTNGTQDITAVTFQTAGDTSNTDSLGIGVFNSIANNVHQVYDNTSLGEVFFINATLSTTDRQKLEGYLAHKWGLTASLPSNHPYKITIPTV